MAVACEVSEWSDWSSCSKSCGFGTRHRERTIIQRPMHYGARCPILVEDELCGSMRGCGWKHFSFGSKRGGSSTRRFHFGMANNRRPSWATQTNSEPGREPAREPVRQRDGEPVKEPGIEPGIEPVKEPVREPVTEPGREPDRRNRGYFQFGDNA